MGLAAGAVWVAGPVPARIGAGEPREVFEVGAMRGWTVIRDDGAGLARVSALAELSRGRRLVASYIEEHVMSSLATGWDDGRMSWLVRSDSARVVDVIPHDPFAPSAGVVIAGDPPGLDDALETARLRSFVTASRGVDHYFDVPPSIAARITGTRADTLWSEFAATSTLAVGAVSGDLTAGDTDPLPAGTRIPDGLPLSIAPYEDDPAAFVRDAAAAREELARRGEHR